MINKPISERNLSIFCIPDVLSLQVVAWYILFYRGGTLIKLCNIYQFITKVSFLLRFPKKYCNFQHLTKTPIFIYFLGNAGLRLQLCCCYYCLEIQIVINIRKYFEVWFSELLKFTRYNFCQVSLKIFKIEWLMLSRSL